MDSTQHLLPHRLQSQVPRGDLSRLKRTGGVKIMPQEPSALHRHCRVTISFPQRQPQSQRGGKGFRHKTMLHLALA